MNMTLKTEEKTEKVDLMKNFKICASIDTSTEKKITHRIAENSCKSSL